MAWRMTRFGKTGARAAGPILLRREMVMFLPAVALAGLWFGLEAMALIGATALLVGWMSRPLGAACGDADDSTGLPLRAEATRILSRRLRQAAATGRNTACLVLGLDDAQTLSHRLGPDRMAEVMRRIADRLHGALREEDRVARLDGARFAILLSPTPRLDLEGLIQLCARLQAAAEAPLSVAVQTVHVDVHIGFCLMHQLPDAGADTLMAAAETAAEEARRSGAGAIRAFSPASHRPAPAQGAEAQNIAHALEAGQVEWLFQPQISTDTGTMSGFDILGTWTGPEGAPLAGPELAAAVRAAGAQDRLFERMLQAAVHAHTALGRNGAQDAVFCLPVSETLMEDPKFISRLHWDLDRFHIPALRIRLALPMEILAHEPEGIVARNLDACAALGCGLDLAGFGDSPLSVNRLRRLGTPRLRIDPSLVRAVDCDAAQQRLIAAVISLAEGMGLETVAGNVGSIAEHAMLSQLGCRHVLGRAIAPPMALQDCFGWLERHHEKLNHTPELSRRAEG